MRLFVFSGKVGEILQDVGAGAPCAKTAPLERLAKALSEASHLNGAQIKKVAGVIRKIEIEPLCAKPRAKRGDNAGTNSNHDHMEGKDHDEIDLFGHCPFWRTEALYD